MHPEIALARPSKTHSSRLVATGVVLVGVLGLRLASEATANVAYLGVAAYALLGRRQAVQALFLSWLLSMINPGLAPPASLGSIGRYAVLFAAAFSVVWRSARLRGPLRMRPLTLWTALLGAAILVHSALFSPIPDVSLLRALSWLFAMTTLLAAWGGLKEHERTECERFVFFGLTAVALSSVPLIGSGIGVLRNESGFQGILNHPQAFGPTMGILGGWAITRFLSQARPHLGLVGLAGLCLVFVLMSEARTGGLAVAVGVVGGVVSVRMLSGRRFGSLLPGLRSARTWAVGFLLIVAALIANDRIGSLFATYITKSGRADVSTVGEAYEDSRGALIERMLENIAEHPAAGIGFGIASDPASMEVERDPVLDLPVGAPIEKGVVPIMVAEELGVPMAILVGLWIFALIRRAAQSGLAPLSATLTVLALNMGEAILFSPGGQGLLVLILLAWAATHPPHRVTEQTATSMVRHRSRVDLMRASKRRA